MKNILFSFCLIVLGANLVYAQNDYSSMYRSIIIKMNPSLLTTGLLADGEFGATVQFPVLRGAVMGSSIDAFIGGGYNRSVDTYTAAANPNGTGYTIRAGFYSYIDEARYLSLQFFYRRWNIKGIYDVGDLPGGEPLDNTLSPSTLYSASGEDSPIQYLENAKVDVYSFDLVYGNQYPHFHEPGQLFFEWYIGVGIREKFIDFEELGTYDNAYLNNNVPNGTYYPLSAPKPLGETNIYPDLKLGIMVGFVL